MKCWIPLLLGSLAVACHQDTPPSTEKTPTDSAANVPTSKAWFRPLSANAGIDFDHQSGHQDRFLFPEIMCGGVGTLDYDQDGLWDLYFVQGGNLADPASPNPPQNRLYRNLGKLQFEDVTSSSGLGDTGYGMGTVCADFDNDGFTDVYVTNVGPNRLYRNQGNGQFQDITEQAGVGDAGWGTSASFLDFNRDGHLDLFVVNYIHWSLDTETGCYSRGGKPDYCSPLSYQAPAPDRLYQNNGDGTFTDVTEATGINQHFGNGLGVACADFNGDGWVDLFVANDAMPNQLWINQTDGSFANEALIRGCAVNGMGLNEAGMGVAIADLNHDGWWDLFLTHLESESNTYYQNSSGYFQDRVQPQGPGVVSWPFTGFGVVFGDYNNDSRIDLYVANGRVKYGPKTHSKTDRFAEPNHLIQGIGNGSYSLHPNAINPAPANPATSRGSIAVDLNNDGRLDLVTANRDHAPQIWINQVVPEQSHWIRFRVLSTFGAHAIGAVVEIQIADQSHRRLVQSGLSYCSSQDPRAHFGLGSQSDVGTVTVYWPDGQTTTHGPYSVDAEFVIQR